MGPAPENARHHAEQPQEQKAQDDQEHHVGAHGGGPVVKVNGEDQLIGGTGEIAHVQIDLIQNKGRQPDPQAGPRQTHPGPEPPAQGEVAQGAQPAPGKGQTQQGNGQHGQGKVPGASLPGQTRQQENGLKGQIDHRLVPGPVPGQGELSEQEGEQGRVISCANHGEVTGDANVGGVAGILATELGLDPEEDLDIQNDKLLSDTTAYIKATVRDCRNAGAVTAKNDCAGGIIGRGEVGAVLDCRNTGDVETTSGGQCGGVAGLSRTVIRRSYALCSLTGNDKVGGVAGEGHDIRECYTMVSVVGGGERFGAVAGMADGGGERNYFVRESLAGIDGVDYAGKAEPMDYEDFAAVPGMPEEFLGFRITFLVDGAAIKTLAVPYGGDLDPESIPEVPRREGVYGAWEDFSQENITRSRTVEAVYSDWITTISTGEEQPVLLLEGAFAPGARLEAEDWTPGAGKLPEGYRLAAGYTFSVEDRGQAEPQGGYTVRVRVPDAKGEVCVAVWQDGALRLPARGELPQLSYGARGILCGADKAWRPLSLALCGVRRGTGSPAGVAPAQKKGPQQGGSIV